ncbi:hypothetical protein PM082_022834 [Marasmius tenuissimus]|nr:hypothetical protein PM082_022834 [Marasmius tenuissimus]
MTKGTRAFIRIVNHSDVETRGSSFSDSSAEKLRKHSPEFPRLKDKNQIFEDMGRIQLQRIPSATLRGTEKAEVKAAEDLDAKLDSNGSEELDLSSAGELDCEASKDLDADPDQDIEAEAEGNEDLDDSSC